MITLRDLIVMIFVCLLKISLGSLAIFVIVAIIVFAIFAVVSIATAKKSNEDEKAELEEQRMKDENCNTSNKDSTILESKETIKE